MTTTTGAADTALLGNEFQVGKPKVSEEFVNKVKEIERRIIQHLRQRGYDESHPDYHRYLRKAKELAIQKAGKERQKNGGVAATASTATSVAEGIVEARL